MKKKSNFKQLAIMGITGGVMIASQGSLQADSYGAADLSGASQYVFKGGKCNGKDGCGGRTNVPGINNDGSPTGGGCSSPSGCSGMKDISMNDDGTDDTQMSQSGNSTDQEGGMSEGELMSKLDYKGRMTYQGLDAEGKALARRLAAEQCAGTNDCKGMNSCKTDTNECAGKGECSGQSGCAFKDKNQAVEVAAKKMAEKRASMGK